MAWQPQYPLIIIPVGGDDIDSAMPKIRDEIARIYTINSGLFAQTGGHGHTGILNDGSQLKTAAYKDASVTVAKLASDVVAGVNLNNWKASQAVTVGEVRYSANLPSYAMIECIVAGTTGTTEPTWGTTIGESVTDNTVTWKIVDIRTMELPGFKGNITTVTSNTAATITSDYGVLINSLGNTVRLSAINQNIATGTTGAGGLDTGALAASTWYYPYVIYGVAGVSAVISASSVSPTLPSGYTYYARLPGALRTDSNKYLMRTLTKGKKTQYVVTASTNTPAMLLMASGTQGNSNTPTWVAISTVPFVPPTAVGIDVITLIADGGSGNNLIIIAPNNSYGSRSSTTNPPPLVNMPYAVSANMVVSKMIILESTNIYCASSVNAYLFCGGWEDNL